MLLARYAGAFVGLTATACVFHHQNVSCDVADAVCGSNESCVVAESGVVCSCGDAQSSSAVCTGGTVCSPDQGACVDNAAPTAVIRNVHDDGTLRVPANAVATLSGADSSDPEGAVLTYAWSFADTCLIDTSAIDLTTATLTFDSTSMADNCVVTLTVTDPLGASGSTQAILMARLVGGYVSATSPCISAYQADSEDSQGTFDAPFCDPLQALIASADNALGEVSLADEDFTITTTLDLGATPMVGGYSVDRSAPWQSGKGTTRLIGGTNATIVRMSEAGETRLVNVEINRSARCTANCTIIEVSTTSATLDSVYIKIDEAAVSSSTPDYSLMSVYAHAASSDAVSTSLHIDNSSISGMTATQTYAVRIDGPVTTVIEGTKIYGGGASGFSAGVRTTNVTSFTMTSSSIQITGPGGATATGAGFADGSNSQTLDSCDVAETSCNGSISVALQDVTVSVQGYYNAYGIAAAKTNTLVLDDVEVTTLAPRSVAVRTLDCTNVSLNAPSLQATAIPTTNSVAQDYFAIGYLDGYSPESNGAPSNGSTKIDIVSGTIGAAVQADSSASVYEVTALMLQDTQQATVNGTQFEATSADGGTGHADVVSAVTTLAANDVAFVDSNMTVSSITASRRLSAFTDGRGRPVTTGFGVSTGSTPSTGLSFSGGQYNADFSDSSVGVERAVMIFTGTKDATVDGAALMFTPGRANSGETIHEAGIWTAATSRLTFENLSIGENAVTLEKTSGTTWIYGILDGPPEGLDDDQTLVTNASYALTLDRNKISLSTTISATLIGILLRGQSTDTSGSAADQYRMVTNSFVDINSDTLGFGIVVDRAAAAVLMNTVRYGICETSSCGGMGAGIYLQHTSDTPAVVIGNVFTVGARSVQSNSPVIIDEEVDQAYFGFLHFDYNARGGYGDPSPIIIEKWCIADVDDSTHFVDIVDDCGFVPEANMQDRINNDDPQTITNNGDGTVTFCDSYHVASGPVANAIPESASFPETSLLEVDIDQLERHTPYDAGANLRSTCQQTVLP